MPPVQTDFRRERKIDYRYTSGVVGQYQGSDIYTILEEDFDVDDSRGDSRLIYALIDREKPDLKLVSAGMWIGDMTSDGYVTLFDKSRFYEKPEWKPAEIEEPIPADIPEVFAANNSPLVASASGTGKTIDDYLAGETLVDRFLREMKEF